MKRRGFLGFLAGGAVAGPSMVKQAASATMADMSLTGVASTGMRMIGGAVNGPPDGPYDDFAGRLVKIGLRTAADHRERERQTFVNALDPDLTTYRSFALHTKVAVQRRRDYWRSVEGEKSWLQRRIDGDHGLATPA